MTKYVQLIATNDLIVGFTKPYGRKKLNLQLCKPHSPCCKRSMKASPPPWGTPSPEVFKQNTWKIQLNSNSSRPGCPWCSTIPQWNRLMTWWQRWVCCEKSLWKTPNLPRIWKVWRFHDHDLGFKITSFWQLMILEVSLCGWSSNLSWKVCSSCLPRTRVRLNFSSDWGPCGRD